MVFTITYFGDMEEIFLIMTSTFFETDSLHDCQCSLKLPKSTEVTLICYYVFIISLRKSLLKIKKYPLGDSSMLV